jgi:glyoxylase-like metal-dependent hydrolase (beta-lactamase superfamily II)
VTQGDLIIPDLSRMERVLSGFYASSPEPLGFLPSHHARAFLLQRGEGNLLIYSTNRLASDAPAIEDLGGLSRRYLNHRHEARLASDPIEAPLFLHENERKWVEGRIAVADTFSEGHRLGYDFEVIPTPGHTSGATAYLWDSGVHRFLFTGDTIYLRDGDWVAAVLDSSEREPYIESLELIRELQFDVLVPWIASAGGPFYTYTSPADARRRIDAILARVRRGADH